jgi:hypothetical protein
MLLEIVPLTQISSYIPLIVIWAGIFQTTFVLTAPVFNWFESFQKLSPIKKIDWALHVVSMLHAVLITSFCIPILRSPLKDDVVFARSIFAEQVYTISLGYFVFLSSYFAWDLYVCLSYYQLIGGFQFVFHAIGALSTLVGVYVFQIFIYRRRYSNILVDVFYSWKLALYF